MDQRRVWSSTYLMEFVRIALAAGNPPDRLIEDFYWNRGTLQVTLRNRTSGRVELWELDMSSGRLRPCQSDVEVVPVHDLIESNETVKLSVDFPAEP